MARYSLNMPKQLKHEAEKWAKQQGVSLNQFIQWAVSEKVGTLNQQLDDPTFPRITYRRSISNEPVPVLRGTNIRVQVIAIAHYDWHLSPKEIASEYGLDLKQITEALAFYETHKAFIEANIAHETALEAEMNG